MISVLGVKNTQDHKIVYEFFSGSELEEPLFADYPLMQDGSTWQTLDTSGDKAVIVNYVLVSGIWVEFTEAGGGDTPTPTPTGDLTSITLQWLANNSSDSGGSPREYIMVAATPTVIDSTFMTTNDYGIQIKEFEPAGATGMSISQNGYYNKCTLTKQADYGTYADQAAWVTAGCPVYIPFEGGDWYEFPGEDTTVTVTAAFGETVLTSTLQIVTP